MLYTLRQPIKLINQYDLSHALQNFTRAFDRAKIQFHRPGLSADDLSAGHPAA